MHQVKAIIVDDKFRYSYLGRFARERFSDSLGFVPALFVFLTLLLVVGVRRLDLLIASTADPDSWIMGSTAALITVTSVISTSMLTFVAVVFSLTLVALQLASQQFSPRVMRTVLRRRTIKVSMGVFIAAFVFSLVILAETVHAQNKSVPLTSLFISMLLVFASLFVLFIFVARMVGMIRVAFIMHVIADETRESIAENLPSEDGYGDCDLFELSQPLQVIKYSNPPRSSLVSRKRQGVMMAINTIRIVRLAHDHNCIIRILPSVGEYIVHDTAVAEIYGEQEIDPQEVLKAFIVGPERSIFQDPAFGFRELVDIAVLALSPGAFVPTTATQAIYRITDLLLTVASRPMLSGYYADRSGSIRLIRPVSSWQDYVDLAFDEIIQFGAPSSQVRAELEHSFDQLLAALPEHYHPPIKKQQRIFNQVIAANKS